MANLKYGTPEFYAEQFSDILTDVDGEDPSTVESIFEGFLKSINEWLIYHEKQAGAYDELHARVYEVLSGKCPWEEQIKEYGEPYHSRF